MKRWELTNWEMDTIKRENFITAKERLEELSESFNFRFDDIKTSEEEIIKFFIEKSFKDNEYYIHNALEDFLYIIEQIYILENDGDDITMIRYKKSKNKFTGVFNNRLWNK